MAEISCAKVVWPEAKINLCWWHLRRAIRTRLAKAKLSTTPYNVEQAKKEYGFIDTDFIPPGTRVDIEDYEGGPPDLLLSLVDAATTTTVPQPPNNSELAATQPQPPPLGHVTNSLRIRLPLANVAAAIPNSRPPQTSPICDGNDSNKENPVRDHQSQGNRIIQGVGFTLRVAGPTTGFPERAAVSEKAAGENEADFSDGEDNNKGRRTFCPALYRDPIVKMIERHYCAHPLVPGYAPPEPIGIKRWAVQQMYNFCVKHELPEVWAYLWENWYRKGRWELWARCMYELIPKLKTTMILESQ